MSESLVKNLKFMLLIIGKAGTRESDCPVSSSLYGAMISWMFDDVSNHPKIIDQYIENRRILDSTIGHDISEAMKDRSLFKHINLFPESIRDKYGEQINWFSRYLANRASDKVIDVLYRYIVAMDSNIKMI